MMKKLKISVSWNADYIIEAEDAIRLLEIANRCYRLFVDRGGRYDGPWIPCEEQEPFISYAELVDYEPGDKALADDESSLLGCAC